MCMLIRSTVQEESPRSVRRLACCWAVNSAASRLYDRAMGGCISVLFGVFRIGKGITVVY